MEKIQVSGVGWGGRNYPTFLLYKLKLVVNILSHLNERCVFFSFLYSSPFTGIWKRWRKKRFLFASF